MALENNWLKEVEIIRWVFSHKRLFKKVFILLFICLDVIIWAIFIYQLTLYIIYTPSYHAMIAELTKERIDFVAYHQRIAPQTIDVKTPMTILLNQKTGQWRYNFIAEAKNPNSIWFIKNINYDFVWRDGRIRGQEIFFLPEEDKYLFALSVVSPTPTVNLKVEIDKINWQRWRPEHQERLKILDELSFRVIKFTPSRELGDKIFPASLQFEAKNLSAYNFRQIEMLIVVYQETKIVDIEMVIIKDLRRGEKRNIDLNLNPQVNFATEIDLVPQINILDPTIFTAP